jgi:hypothetical protein
VSRPRHKLGAGGGDGPVRSGRGSGGNAAGATKLLSRPRHKFVAIQNQPPSSRRPMPRTVGRQRLIQILVATATQIWAPVVRLFGQSADPAAILQSRPNFCRSRDTSLSPIESVSFLTEAYADGSRQPKAESNLSRPRQKFGLQEWRRTCSSRERNPSGNPAEPTKPLSRPRHKFVAKRICLLPRGGRCRRQSAAKG